jgi:transcriptional regulator with XRE-family HTH domain
VTQGPGPTVARLRLGRELRRARESAQLSREDVANFLERDISTVSKMEIGKMTASHAEVMALLGFLGVTDQADTERILGIAREARKRSRDRVPEWARTFVGLEAEAVEIRSFVIDLVPGLLQTEEYTRAIASAVDPTPDPAEVERLVKIRRERQARLTGDNPLRLRAVLDEAAIRRVVGGADVMRGQLRRLLELGNLSNVSLQVLPFGAGAHPAMGTAFHVVRLPEPDSSTHVYLEDLWSAEYLDREAQVNAYARVFDRLSGAALDPASAASVIEEATGDLQ